MASRIHGPRVTVPTFEPGGFPEPEQRKKLPPRPPCHCIRCGTEFKYYRNRQYCGVCQCLRDLRFMERESATLRTTTCRTCAKKYYPIRSGYTQCYECTDFSMRSGVRDRFPECRVCTLRKRPAPGTDDAGKPTCISCVQSAAGEIRRYHAFLLKLVSSRITARNKEVAP